MQINNSVVNLGGMNTIQGNAFQRSVKIPGQKGSGRAGTGTPPGRSVPWP